MKWEQYPNPMTSLTFLNDHPLHVKRQWWSGLGLLLKFSELPWDCGEFIPIHFPLASTLYPRIIRCLEHIKHLFFWPCRIWVTNNLLKWNNYITWEIFMKSLVKWWTLAIICSIYTVVKKYRERDIFSTFRRFSEHLALEWLHKLGNTYLALGQKLNISNDTHASYCGKNFMRR